MLDSVAQLFQHPRTQITHGLQKSYGLYPSHYALQLPTVLAMHTTANIVGSTMLGVGHAAEDQKQIRTSSW